MGPSERVPEGGPRPLSGREEGASPKEKERVPQDAAPENSADNLRVL
jgi:hypothetical protein